MDDLSEAYDPNQRVAECPDEDASNLSRIEVDFAIPVYVTREQSRRLGNLIEEITKSPWNEPKEGVHWLASVGSKPKFSQADALFLGKAPDPNAPLDGEPEFDHDVLHFETFAREFVATRERDRVLRQREGLGLCSDCNEPQFMTPSGPTCKNGHGGAPTK